MRVFLGLGSNEGNRLDNLEQAIKLLRELEPLASFRISPLYETPALKPAGAPAVWDRPYFNLVVSGEVKNFSPEQFLTQLKMIEKKIGRAERERWAPRVVDIDILFWGDSELNLATLQIPHRGIKERAFVLDPLKDLAPRLLVEGETALARARNHPQHSPLLMGIVNVTPDSFSDGASWSNPERLLTALRSWHAENIAFVDFGAESTRPGFTPVAAADEIARLAPAIEAFHEWKKTKLICPRLSVDTRKSKVAAWALEVGAEVINDVEGLSDPGMLSLLQSSQCDYVLMHNGPVQNPVADVKRFFIEKIELLDRRGICLDRIVLDPGIGFGKSAEQSLQLLKQLSEFKEIPCRLLVGHSRKSFMAPFSSSRPLERDIETLAISLELAKRGADILRVHEPLLHARALRAQAHLEAP